MNLLTEIRKGSLRLRLFMRSAGLKLLKYVQSFILH